LRRPRKSYETPIHPWETVRMGEEAEVLKKYGLKNKRELWKTESHLRKYRREARKLLATKSDTSEKEAADILKSLKSKGMLKEDATLDDVLALTIDDFLERRLQTKVFRQGLATSINQARQLITHGHIAVDGRRVSIPSYIVDKEEEGTISYYAGSPITNELHPVRPKAKA